jgi:hypothetical protein
MANIALRIVFLSAWLAGWEAAARPTACTAPAWILDNMSLNFRNPSHANFTLTNTATSVSEAISCALEFATLCEIRGTPKNKDLYIHIQTKGPAVWVNVTSPYTCDGRLVCIFLSLLFAGDAEMVY